MEHDGEPKGPTGPPPQPGQHQPPPSGYGQQPYGAPVPPPNYAYPVHYPEASEAVVALVLSIIGLVACSGLLCPVGWWYSNKELAGIDAGLRDPSKRDTAKAAQVIGIIGTVLLALGILAIGAFILIAVVSASGN